MLQLFFHRLYMFPHYSALSDFFYIGAKVNFGLISLAAGVHSFLFLLLYAQVSDYFVQLKGGFIFGLLLGIMTLVPMFFLQLASLGPQLHKLQDVLGLWSYFGLVANLMLGAIAGVVYSPYPKSDT